MTVAWRSATDIPDQRESWLLVRSTSQPDTAPAGVLSVLYSARGELVTPWDDRLLAWAAVPAGEHWALPLQRALGEHDLVPRAVHPIARLRQPDPDSAPDWLVTWAEVRHRRYEALAPGLLADPDDAARGTGAAVERRVIEVARADRDAGVSPRRWHRDMAAYVEASYLADDDEFRQSGKGGDAADWELSRRIIADAVDRSGSFMDIGCANGLLLQSMLTWAAQRGHSIVPYGIDVVPRLVELAARRLPQRQRGNLWCGNAATWTPPLRFDFVHTLLGYVPRQARAGYVRRLLRSFVAPGGRLIVSDYGHGPDEPAVPDALRSWGIAVTGEAIQDRGPDRSAIHVTWVDRRGEE